MSCLSGSGVCTRSWSCRLFVRGVTAQGLGFMVQGLGVQGSGFRYFGGFRCFSWFRALLGSAFWKAWGGSGGGGGKRGEARLVQDWV